MCFNAQSSITTFFIVLCCSIFLYIRNYRYGKTLALIFFTVALMQLAEFFMWSDLKCGNMNDYATKFAFIVLCLEPVIVTFAVYNYNVSKIPNKYLKWIFYFYLIFFGLFIFRTLIYNKKLCSLPSKKLKHLIWDHGHLMSNLPKLLIYSFWILYFCAGLLFLSFKNIQVGVTYLLLIVITIVLSKYFTRNSKNSLTWKSLWCLIINIIPFLAIGIGEYYHIKDNI
tara:strand:+ start:261 stop:938 length:678 start_codon:yes stop_codon:yes gene_type:complete